ncbi:PREDICTED: RING finger protein 39 [Galeopterus variegatus]|uniref:RING finger protein 39 n=1 Tax=Galeopterus variegatus TaxID=482537 RepID=A0ABM0S2K1_GALVR|nr:PREDICTED: RING finger protein 39 [Galeopterus variegatus]
MEWEEEDNGGRDMRKTWRRFDVPTPKSSNSEDDLPEEYPVVKNMLHRLTADLTLDPGTAHRRLLISADHRSVRLAPPGTPVPPDGPKRFDQLPAVLGAQGFGAGRHCWEVETADAASCRDSSGEEENDGESRYAVGAAGESVQRKGRVRLCPAGAVWALEGRGGRLWALTAPEPTLLGGAGPTPRRIRVDLDWERGRVAFYDGRSLDLLYAFQAPGPLGERIFPLLCTRDPSTPLRIVPAEG